MQTLGAILTTLGRLRPRLRSEYGVTEISVFGSYARGDASETSDLDLLVDVDPSARVTYFGLAKLEKELEAELGVRIDLFTRGGLNPRMAPYILPTLVGA